jgi:threonine aldolase
MKSFASDNYSGIHPEIFEAIQHANTQHEISYGDDYYTIKTQEQFQQLFGNVKVL